MGVGERDRKPQMHAFITHADRRGSQCAFVGRRPPEAGRASLGWWMPKSVSTLSGGAAPQQDTPEAAEPGLTSAVSDHVGVTLLSVTVAWQQRG